MAPFEERHLVSVRLEPTTKHSLAVESVATGRTLSDTIRVICNRHVARETPAGPLIEELASVKVELNTLATDLEMIARLLFVGLKLGTDEEAKEWVRDNLRGGR